jgi:hypothetical protein
MTKEVSRATRAVNDANIAVAGGRPRPHGRLSRAAGAENARVLDVRRRAGIDVIGRSRGTRGRGSSTAATSAALSARQIDDDRATA